MHFFGAAGTVTGSRYLVESGESRVLVDAGLFQGFKQLRLRNRARFPVPPSSIDAILLTHAHLDHSGYVPRLFADGFHGPVYCTPGTYELCRLLLPDSGRLQEEEAAYATRKHFSKHAEPRPLYTEKDALDCLGRFKPVRSGRDLQLGPSLTAKWIPAGHLLGASQIRVEAGGHRIHFSGDLGRADDALTRPPAPFEGADLLVCESTYGNRQHPKVDVEAQLGAVVRRIAARSGVLIIPAFAVGRVQGVMLHLARLRRRGEIPALPMYLNSPMAIAATDIYRRFEDEHRASAQDLSDMFELATPVRTVEESKALNTRKGPMIIISASGMLTGGRVLHHVATFGPDPRNAILLSGFQAGGTRGATLQAGGRMLRMFGQEVPIGAEVIEIQGLSGHADADGLIAWARGGARPRQTFVTHGEPEAADILRWRFERELGWPARVPEHLEVVDAARPSDPEGRA